MVAMMAMMLLREEELLWSRNSFFCLEYTECCLLLLSLLRERKLQSQPRKYQAKGKLLLRRCKETVAKEYG